MVRQWALSHTLHLWSMSEAQQNIILLKPTSYLKHLTLYMICTPLKKRFVTICAQQIFSIIEFIHRLNWTWEAQKLKGFTRIGWFYM